MRLLKLIGMGFTVLCFIAVIPAVAMSAQLVDVEKELIKRINADSALKAKIIKQAFGLT